MCYHELFSEEDLCQKEINKEKLSKGDGRPKWQSNFEAEEEESFWETKSISDEPDVTTFLHSIKDEGDAVPRADEWFEDNLSQNSWSSQTQGEPPTQLILSEGN